MRNCKGNLTITWRKKLLEKLREAELISEGELDKITAKNRQSFSPYLARIMP